MWPSQTPHPPRRMADLCTSLQFLFGSIKILGGAASNTQGFSLLSVFIQGLGEYS